MTSLANPPKVKCPLEMKVRRKHGLAGTIVNYLNIRSQRESQK
jgi:hypothetical protein